MSKPSEKDRQATKLRADGLTFAEIAEELEYENDDAAMQAVWAVLRGASVAPLTSVGDSEFNTVYEVRIRLTTTGGDLRVPVRMRELMEQLYETEAKWELMMRYDENVNGAILQEPTTFSVSKVMVDQAPQTGKHIIFPEV